MKCQSLRAKVQKYDNEYLPGYSKSKKKYQYHVLILAVINYFIPILHTLFQAFSSQLK